MQSERQTIMIGSLIAIAVMLGAIALGVNATLAGAIALIWCGTLWLAKSAPPDTPRPPPGDHQAQGGRAEIIERLAAPTLLTHNGRIIMASKSAREILGPHIITQDIRVVLRQPEAAAMLTAEDSNTAMIHGLVRRRDSWRVSRTLIDPNTALIEFANQTAEVDMSHAHSEFVANASHELRTPLASIIAYSETLEEAAEQDEIDQPTAQRFLGTILQEARRMQSLISDLMSLSRIEAERHGTPTERITLAPLVTRAARDAAGPNRRDELRFNVAENIDIHGDEKQIEQMTRNLVDNALKYRDNNEPVDISLTSDEADEFAVLVVSDSGAGIAPQHIPHLTRRFYRTDPGRSRASGGTGLGLAIVKHIVERHRGRLNIASTPGEGTNVTVRLPLAAVKRGS